MKNALAKFVGLVIALVLVLPITVTPKAKIGTSSRHIDEKALAITAFEAENYPSDPPDPMEAFLPKYPTPTPLPQRPTSAPTVIANVSPEPTITWDLSRLEQSRKDRLARLEEGIGKVREAFARFKRSN